MYAPKVVLPAPLEAVHPHSFPFHKHPAPACPEERSVTPLEATLMNFPVSVAYKRLSGWLTPLPATLTKNIGGRVPASRALRATRSSGPAFRDSPTWQQPAPTLSGSPVTSHQSPRTFSTPVLVHPYLAKLNRFCTRSPIVPWTPPGYTLSSTRRTAP
jgi:hypothetical protein